MLPQPDRAALASPLRLVCPYQVSVLINTAPKPGGISVSPSR